MKNTIKITVSLLALAALLLCAAACGEKVDASGIWENAEYLSDTTVGNGNKTVTLTVTAEGQSVVLTVKTDKDTLGDALYELKIVNDASFFDTCIGMKADWEKDKAYWAFKIDGQMASYGIGDAKIEGGESFTFEYTK